MNKLGIFIVLVSLIALTIAEGFDDDYYRSTYDDSKKVVYVEKEYRRPNVKIIKKEPDYKKVVYKYEKPEEKKVLVNVKVVKPQERPDEVVYKYIDRRSRH